MTNDRGMAAGAEIGLAGRDIQARDKFAQCVSDSHALKIRQTNRAMLAPAGATRMGEGKSRREGGGTTLDFRDEALSRAMQRAAQIMMPAKNVPFVATGFADS